MASIALSFNNVDLTPIAVDNNDMWFTANDLAKALEYKNVRSIYKIYNANADEFTDKMTTVTVSVTQDINGRKRKLSIRIFSLRGCHLMGMFARTTEAKKFRHWVLNVLDDEVDKINAERDSLSFKYNQTCATAALVQRDLSQAGRDLRHLGQKVMPELLDKLAALESMIQPQLPNLEVVK